MLNFNKTQFVTSAPTLRQLPLDAGVEIAFAGRSNAGKSSALNRLCRHRQLARTSKTPGRTQLINLFEVAPGKRIVDLPGYGFAKVPLEVKEKWQRSLTEYLRKRKSLKGIVVLMDIRHPFKDLDQQVIHWAVQAGLPVLALLTKADKFKTGQRRKTELECQEAALAFMGDVTVMSFSSLTGHNEQQVSAFMSNWLEGLEAEGDAEAASQSVLPPEEDEA